MGPFTPGPAISDLVSFRLFAEIAVIPLMFSVEARQRTALIDAGATEVIQPEVEAGLTIVRDAWTAWASTTTAAGRFSRKRAATGPPRQGEPAAESVVDGGEGTPARPAPPGSA